MSVSIKKATAYNRRDHVVFLTDNVRKIPASQLSKKEIDYAKMEFKNKNKAVVINQYNRVACVVNIPADKKEGQIYEAIVVDTSLHVLYKKEIAVPMNEKHFATLDFVLTDEGNFFLLGIKFLTDKKVKAPNESFYQLYGYDFLHDITDW